MLVYGDIDRFKVYNDQFGTAEGDKLLRAIGAKIRTMLPKEAVAARLRADHYVCCLPRNSFKPDSMLAVFDEWFASQHKDFTFFVRLGIYLIDDPHLEVSLMCDRALLALRSAKNGNLGSKYTFYDETLRDSVLKEQELAGEMSSALQNGQFVPYFQPQYNYRTGRMIGAEVLARWNHPVKGLLGPVEFIPVFERTGIITTFDYHMWEMACRHLRAWIDTYGVENVPRLSVNLSRVDIYQVDLCSYVTGLVKRFDIPVEMLHLEITESAYMDAPEQLIATVLELREAGFIVEMDDFGGGYSSLNTLKDVPVDVLKLDMGFLEAKESTRGGLILASIVRMARWLDLPTIAEGVETVEQANYLASVGCNYLQGYLFSHPIDAATFEELFDEVKTEGAQRPLLESVQEDFADFWNADSRMTLMFNNFVGAAAIAEFDGYSLEVMRANREFTRMFDFSEGESDVEKLREDMLEQVIEQDREALIVAINRTIEGARDVDCEFRYVSNENPRRWIRANLQMLSHAGDVSILYLLAEETTEEQTLRDRLMVATDTIPGSLSFYELGEDLRLLEFSDAAAEIAGCTREQYEELSREDPLGIVFQDDRHIALAAIDELREGAPRTSCTVRMGLGSEMRVWMHLSMSAIYRGDLLFVAVVAIDVTKDKENERRLREQNDAHQRLADAIPCGIVCYTVDDDEHIVSINKRGCEMLGYKSLADYIAATDDHALMPIFEDDVPVQRRVIKQLKEGSPPIDFLYRYYRYDGSIGWLEGTSAFEEDAEGRPVIQSAFVDVTDRQQKSHELDMQRYATVLCSVYEEIFELDVAQNSFRILHSADRRPSEATLSIEEALARWATHIPDADDCVRLQEMIKTCRGSDDRKPVSCTYMLNSAGQSVWFQSTILRVSSSSMLCCNKDVTERLSMEERKVAKRVAGTMGRLPVGVGVFSLQGTTVFPLYFNDLMSTMFGFTVDEYTKRIERGLALLNCERVTELIERIGLDELTKGPIDIEVQMARKDGSPLDVRIQGRVLKEDRRDMVLYAVVTDITEELRNRHEQAWQTERYRLLSEMTHAVSFDYDSETDTVLLYIDRTGNGVEAQVIPHYLETLTSTRSGVVHPDNTDEVRQLFEQARNGLSEVSAEYQADYYGRGYAWYRANLFVTHDEAGIWHLVGLIDNIDNERDLRFRAEYDATTGLSNHAATKDLITEAFSDREVCAQSVCVVLDIDDFKRVNDNCGHMEGDTLLHEVGAILRSSFRDSDVVGRVGGDEFVLLLKDIDLDIALQKLDRVRRRISNVPMGALGHAPSISVGVYVSEPGDKTYRDVFVKADEALYRAKRDGKNCVRVYSDGDS